MNGGSTWAIRRWSIGIVMLLSSFAIPRVYALPAEQSPIEAYWVKSHQAIIVNLTSSVQGVREVTFEVSCARGLHLSEIHTLSGKRNASFNIPLPPNCDSPLLHVSETAKPGDAAEGLDFRIVPVVQPSSKTTPPSWLGTVVGAAIALLSTVLATVLSAWFTESREKAKSKFELRRAIVEKEIEACNTLMRLCRRIPSLNELQQAVSEAEAGIAPDSAVLAAFDHLREEARVEGGLKHAAIENFKSALMARRAELLQDGI